MRIALAAVLLLAACRPAPAPENQAAEIAAPAEPAAPAAKADGDVAAAQRLVRRRLGGGGPRFLEAHAHRSGRVTIVCGAYEQGGVRRRYITVGADQAFIEPGMRRGEMDRAFREFCGDGELG